MVEQAISTHHIITQRMKSIKRVLWIVFLLNLVVALAKYAYGVLTDSASMQADGIHSIFDSAGNIVGIVGITIAARPADDGHPYGHAKFETCASIIIGALLLLAAFNVASSAISSLYYGETSVRVTFFSFAVMVGTLIINTFVTLYERKEAKRLKSEILAADACHTLSDVLVSAGVIAGLALTYVGFEAADSLMALIVSIAILRTAIEVFKSASTTLSDHARIPETEIRACALSVPGALDAHKIRTRGTEGEVYVDLHVLVDPDMSVRVAHSLSEEVERTIQASFPQVAETLVHIEPDDGHVE